MSGAKVTTFCHDIRNRRTHVFLKADVVDGQARATGSMQSPMLIAALVVLLRGGNQVKYQIKELSVPLIALTITTVSVSVKCTLTVPVSRTSI